jgi:hypothetical protein
MINFPDTPATGDHLVAGGATWVWDGNKWTTVAGLAAGGGFLPLSGGTMTGPIHMAADPGTPLEPATKNYADKFLPLLGGPMSGPVSNLTLSADPIVAGGAATKRYADSKLALAGGGLTGPLILAADPAAPLAASTKQYTDTKFPISGGTLTGSLTLNSGPQNTLDAATKGYVDTALKTRVVPLTFVFPGKPAANAQYNITMGLAASVPANLVGAQTYDTTLPTGNSNFIVNKLSGGNTPIQIGGITITSAGHNTNTKAGVGGLLNIGDVLQVLAPSGQDPTLADVSITILVTLQ